MALYSSVGFWKCSAPGSRASMASRSKLHSSYMLSVLSKPPTAFAVSKLTHDSQGVPPQALYTSPMGTLSFL